MFFASILAGSLVYLFFSRAASTTPRVIGLADDSSRETRFKNPYHPVESGFLDHAWRHTQNVANAVDYGWPTIGKLEYANPLPYIVENEFISSLNETGEGYAIEQNKDLLLKETGRGAIDVPGQIALIEDSFTLEEHPRLDLTRQDISKGRHRRRQWSFVPSD